MKDAIIIQQVYKFYSEDDYTPMLDLVKKRHQTYADKWNMDYLAVYGNVREDWQAWHGGWAKVELVRKMLARGYEYVFWVDADAAIIDFNTDLRTGCPDGLGMVQHDGPGTPGPHLNVGVMFIKNSPEMVAFFDEWASRYPGTTEFPWYEQGEANKMAKDLRWQGLVHKIENKWNSCEWARTHVPDAVIEGWHGMGNGAARFQQMKAYLEKR